MTRPKLKTPMGREVVDVFSPRYRVLLACGHRAERDVQVRRGDGVACYLCGRSCHCELCRADKAAAGIRCACSSVDCPDGGRFAEFEATSHD